MYFHKRIYIAAIICAVGEAAVFSYYSSKALDQNEAYETSIFSISSNFMCSQKCLDFECYHIAFDDTENTCSIAGKVINVPPSSMDNIRQASFSMCNNGVNIVHSSFQTASSSIYRSYREPEKGIDGDFDTIFHTLDEWNPWWSIDLNQYRFVSKIHVTIRERWPARFGDVSIYFSPVPETDPTKFKDLPLLAAVIGDLPETSWTQGWTINSATALGGGLNGRYMYIYMHKKSVLEFQELEIYGC